MRAIVINAILNSLYSIRNPLTWQSSLTYPVLPPSGVIGLLANALQRYRNDEHPLRSLDEVEENVVWAGARLLAPLVIRSCTTSAIVKWEVRWGEKCTNVLVREYGYTTQMQFVAILKCEQLQKEWLEALKGSPLTCGDSESPISVESVTLSSVEECFDKTCITKFPIAFDDDVELLDGSGITYWMHERCRQSSKTFPLKCYMIPLKEEKGLFLPASIEVKVKAKKVLNLKDGGNIVI